MKDFLKKYSFYCLFILGMACLLQSGCSTIPRKPSPDLQVVPYVDLDRYLGKWYEIALYPNWFEEGCFRSTAFYEKLEGGKIKVTNQCRMHEPEGELNEAIGIANIDDPITNAKLKVQFFWPFKGNYWIIDLDANYQYAVVSEPGRQYLWILSRSPNMDHQTLEALKEKIRSKGFDLKYLKMTAR
ncbi:MAG: lipocalin family protein [Nitrospinota bacterium]